MITVILKIGVWIFLSGFMIGCFLMSASVITTMICDIRDRQWGSVLIDLVTLIMIIGLTAFLIGLFITSDAMEKLAV